MPSTVNTPIAVILAIACILSGITRSFLPLIVGAVIAIATVLYTKYGQYISRIDSTKAKEIFQSKWFIGLVVFTIAFMTTYLTQIGFGVSVLDVNTFWLAVILGIAITVLMIYFLRNFLGWIILVLLVIAFIFQWPRDAIMDLVNRPEVSTAIVGTETARSLRVSRLDGWEICDLKPESTYTFVKATTEKLYGDDTSYKIRKKKNKREEVIKITGMEVSSPEKLPYPDAKYAFGILLNNTPPGRRVTTDNKGCLQGRFNTSFTSYEIAHPIHMGFTLRN